MLSEHTAASLHHVVHSPGNLHVLRALITALLHSPTTVLCVADGPVSAVGFCRFIYAVETVATASVPARSGTQQRPAIRGLNLNAHVARQRPDGGHTHDVAVQALVLQPAHHAPACRRGGGERRCGDAVVAVTPPWASVQHPRPRLPRGQSALWVVAVELRRLAQAAALRRLRMRLRNVGGDGALRLQVRLRDVGRGQVFGAQRPRQRQLRPQAQGEGVREDGALGASPGGVQRLRLLVLVAVAGAAVERLLVELFRSFPQQDRGGWERLALALLQTLCIERERERESILQSYLGLGHVTTNTSNILTSAEDIPLKTAQGM